VTEVPRSLSFTADHEWVRDEGGGRWRIGITDHAQAALGDVVFVDLPTVGAPARRGSPLGEVESTKTVSDVVAPLDGVVAEVNERLRDDPALVNTAPYGDGWLCVIESSGAEPQLLTASEYERLVGGPAAAQATST